MKVFLQPYIEAIEQKLLGLPAAGPALNGWPGLDGIELVSPAALTVTSGQPDYKGWPTVDVVRSSE